jgi:Leucine-rich repeat (LRR) protein
LKDLQTLQSLTLERIKLTEAGLQQLAALKNLRALHLFGDELTDTHLVPIGKMTKLRELTIYSKKVTPAGYAHVAGLTELEEMQVGVSRDIGDDCLTHMTKMTRLRIVHLGGDKLTDAGMAHVKNFTELRELWMEGPKVTATGLGSLAALRKLEKLTVFSCTAFNGDGLAPLKEMTELKELDLVYCGETNAKGTAYLQGLAKLKKLRLSGVEDAALEPVGKLKALEELDLNYTRVGDEGVKHLAGMTNLRSLILIKTQVTDKGMNHLSTLTGLKRLSIGENKITDEGLQALAGMKALEDLSITDCKITGSGFKHLSGLTNLKGIWAGGNPLTDVALPPLKDLKKLNFLSLTGSKVTDEVVLALKKDLPEARILDYAGDEVLLEKKEPRKKVVEDISKIEPAFSMTAEMFAAECKDRKAASDKYKGKVIELSGVVKSLDSNFSEDVYVSLAVDKDITGVMCYMATPEPWAKVVPGQKIKLKGKFPEDAFGAALVHCVFVDTGTNPAITMTAQQLAKEYAADKEAANKKYNEKYLILTGEVVDRQFNSAGAASMTLKVDGKVRVKVSFTAFDKGAVKPIKVGQQLKVVGQYALNFDAEEVSLYFCHPIKQP